jgi:ketosteroid isomerase-like protein
VGQVNASEQNVELVRRFFDAGTQYDPKIYLSFFGPDAEVDFSELDRPYRGVYRGPEEIERLYHDLRDPWHEKEFELEDVLASDDRVVVTLTRTARSLAGPSLTSRATAMITVRQARITAFKMYGSRSEALKAAGLSESWAADEPAPSA